MDQVEMNVCTLTEVGVLAEDDWDGALASHDGNLSIGPRVVCVAAQMLRAHHTVRATVRL